MPSRLLIGGLLATALIVPAFAQSTSPPATQSPPPAATPAPQAPANQTVTAPKPAGDLWRSSKLVGLDIYNEQNEKLGDVSEVLIDKSGKVAGVVIGVGGFLGMGQHDIMVEMSKLKFVNEPVKASTANTGTTTTTTTTGTGTGAGAGRTSTTQTQTSSNANANKWYPDHAVLAGMTKDQLKAMPQFKFD
jgi:sporulation protein YlmC with PRC-barrel domain